MKQRLIKSIAVLLLSLLPAISFAHDFEVNGIYYKITSSINRTVDVTYMGNSIYPAGYSGSVNIPNSVSYNGITYSVTGIGEHAFNTCRSLITVELPSSLITISDGAFMNCSSMNSIEIPYSVTKIGNSAFAGCETLASIEIPNNVTALRNYTFKDCTSLSAVIIPNSITGIDEGAFQGCTSLISIIIPNSVQYIDEYAFYNCSNLTDVTIGNSVNYIYNRAFYNCSSLKKVYCYAENPPRASIYSDKIFESRYTQNSTLYVPKNSVDSYKNNSLWCFFGAIRYLGSEELVDGAPYTNAQNFDCSELTYTRNFTNTNWNALYVPFAMQYDDWADDFEVARLNDVHQFDDDEDGVIDRTVLEMVKMKDGSVTEPNTPYMIKAKEAGEKMITVTDGTLYATKENSFDVTSWYTKFTFTGTYSTITDMATKGHYALADGNLMQASTDAATLGAFRWYLDITDRNGNPTPLNARKVFLSFDDGETTAVDLVEANTNTGVGSIYSMDGVKVRNDKSSLPKGLYISNGKKFLVK